MTNDDTMELDRIGMPINQEWEKRLMIILPDEVDTEKVAYFIITKPSIVHLTLLVH